MQLTGMNRSSLLLLAAVATAAHAQVPALQRDLTLGCDGCPAAGGFARINDIAVSPSGGILVAERDAPMLRVFDATGKPVWQGGTKGGGPGEYTTISRAFLRDDGRVVVVDFGQRVTTLGPDHRVASTVQLQRWPTTAAMNDAGDLLIGSEGAIGNFSMVRVRDGAVTPVALPALQNGAPGSKNSSIALAPNGQIAFWPHAEHYAIARVDASGKAMSDVTRTVERVHNSVAEQAQRDSARNRELGQMAQMSRARGGSGKVSELPSSSDRTLKPYLQADNLRYDAAGRLWVLTSLGDETKTLCDVFTPSGAFLGSVALPPKTEHFAFGGKYLVTTSEDADGVPVVIRWIVR